VHAVLGNFVDAARRWLLVYAVEMVERPGAFADGISLLDRFCDVGLREKDGVPQRASARQLRRNRRRESAARAMRVFRFYVVAAESEHFRAVK